MKIHKKLAIAAIIALSITSLTACGGKDTVADTAAAGLPAVTGNAGEAPTIAAPTGTAPTTLQTSDIIVGSGTEVVATSTLTVHYTLMSWSNGAIVESSWSSGQPATFPLSGVIAGWQQGLPGAKVGGRRLLVIPADLGYGPNGSGPIGPNETLIFVVDIIGVS
jgi:peptidylprolyl isomerase